MRSNAFSAKIGVSIVGPAIYVTETWSTAIVAVATAGRLSTVQVRDTTQPLIGATLLTNSNGRRCRRRRRRRWRRRRWVGTYSAISLACRAGLACTTFAIPTVIIGCGYGTSQYKCQDEYSRKLQHHNGLGRYLVCSVNRPLLECWMLGT